MRTHLLFLILVMVLSGCVTTTFRDGKPVETPQEEKGSFATAKAPGAPSNLNTNVTIELVPRKDNPELYEYRIVQVFPKTVYSKAGIKSGDTLLSVDGKPVQTMADALNIPAKIGSGDFNKLLVRRNGKNIILQAKN